MNFRSTSSTSIIYAAFILNQHVLLIARNDDFLRDAQRLRHRAAAFQIVEALHNVIFFLIEGTVLDETLESLHGAQKEAFVDATSVLAQLPHELQSRVGVHHRLLLLLEEALMR